METDKEMNLSKIIAVPSHVKGMKILNREAFKKTVKIPFISMMVNQIQPIKKKLKQYVLKMDHLPPIQDNEENKSILLNPTLFQDSSHSIHNFVKDMNLNVEWKDVTLTYENWKHDAILKAILPPELGDGVSGFSIIGHIIHLNLKEPFNEYKHIIGEVLLDKFPRMKTVVNKVSIIEEAFRSFKMEVIAGEPNFIVSLKENQCKYEFDFSKVFWNPRLSHEHLIMVAKINSDDVVYDVFAGVGPFAIPAAKKRTTVYANDLNPESYKWLCHNAELNKVTKYLESFNLDGRDFIRNVIGTGLPKLWASSQNTCSVHIIMNLPECALTFLDAFKSLISYQDAYKDVCMPIIHCYFFVKKNSENFDEKTYLKQYFDKEMEQSIIKVVPVRLVAPNKEMFRVTFTLPRAYLFNSFETDYEECGNKRIKLNNS